MSGQYSEGDEVKWNWGNGWAEGKVVRRYTDKVTLTIKGTDVNREASNDEPAYKIEQEDGDEVLKSGSELEGA
jgi:hypothetical protein